MCKKVPARDEPGDERFRLLFENSLDAMALADDLGRYLDVNQAACDLFGYTREQMLGMSVGDLITGQARGAKEQYRQYLQTGRDTGEFSFVRADGTRRIASYSACCLLPGQHLSILRDITESKRQQEALRESEQRCRFMAEAIPQIVWTADHEGRLDYCNPRWVEYTGLTAEQTTGWVWNACTHHEDLQPTLDAWQEVALAGGLYSIEHRLRSKNGAYRWFLTRAVAMRDAEGNILKWFGTATDIEDQKRAQEREQLLGRLGEQMRTSADPQEILWAVVSAIGEYLRVSRCYYTETDVDAGQTVIYRDYCRGVESWAGTYALSAFGTGVIAELNRGQTVAIADTMTDSRTALQYEATYAPLNIRAYLAVPLMENGKRVASLVVSASGALRAWTAEETALLETAAERTRLAVKNSRLWKAERERSDQLARAIQEVHHRVKNSLQSVSALLEMQLPFEGDTLPVSTVRDSLNQIKTIALVHDLLARDQPIGNVDAARVLTKLVALLAAGMQTGKHAPPLRIHAQQLWIPTKAATALALAVNELVSNAVKHNSKSSLSNPSNSSNSSNCEDTNNLKAIEVHLTRHNGEVHVTVQDNGPGFPANFNPILHANIGLELVLTLVHHDLRGSVTFSNCGGRDVNARSQGGHVEIIFAEDAFCE